MITLGSDYSGSAIYLGLLYDKKVIGTANIDMTNPKSGMRVIRSLLKDYVEEYGLEKIWAEEAWINGMRFPKSGAMLSRTAAFLEVAAADTELQIEFVHPMTWRKAVYGHAKPPNPKEVARAYVRELFGYDIPLKKDHNTAEAILLAYYGALRHEQ